MNCQYNHDRQDKWADCSQEAAFTVISTCCGKELCGCLEHVNAFMDQVAEANGFLDHPACGAWGTAGFRIEPLDV